MGKFSKALEKYEKNEPSIEVESFDEIKKKKQQQDEIKKKKQHVDQKSKKIFLAPNKKKLKLAPNLITVSQPQSYESEQFRSLKTNLLFSSERGVPRTIMVTSAIPDEGKSFVAANLAVTFAQSVDEHVLLMDCDLRLPTVHRVFGLPDNTPGLSDLLAGRKEIPDVLYKTGVDKLTILPGGNKPLNPTELLSSKRMKNLLMELESRYKDRYIIIDSPPPLLTAESIALARQVDGILIVIRHEKTSRNDVKEMTDLIDKDKIMGVIVNRYDVRLGRYYGYGKYGAYYGKKQE